MKRYLLVDVQRGVSVGGDFPTRKAAEAHRARIGGGEKYAVIERKPRTHILDEEAAAVFEDKRFEEGILEYFLTWGSDKVQL